MSTELTDTSVTKLETLQAGLQACRLQGYDRIDPLRFYYLASLLQRSASRQHNSTTLTQRLLDKTSRLLSEFQESCEQKQQQAEAGLATEPALSASLTALKALNSRLKQQSDSNAPSVVGNAESSCEEENQAFTQERLPRQDLQAVKQYQKMFEKMAVERLLNKVMQEIPENAGPLNPERVVIRCLSALQDISPAYAMRLISYYESLICLQSMPVHDK